MAQDKRKLLEKLQSLLAKPLVVGSGEQEEALRLAGLLGVRLRFGESEVVSRLPHIRQDLKTPATNESTATPSRSGQKTGGSTNKATKTPAPSWVEHSEPE